MISRCLPQLAPASWRREQLELLPAASWRLTFTLQLIKVAPEQAIVQMLAAGGEGGGGVVAEYISP